MQPDVDHLEGQECKQSEKRVDKPANPGPPIHLHIGGCVSEGAEGSEAFVLTSCYSHTHTQSASQAKYSNYYNNIRNCLLWGLPRLTQ